MNFIQKGLANLKAIYSVSRDVATKKEKTKNNLFSFTKKLDCFN